MQGLAGTRNATSAFHFRNQEDYMSVQQHSIALDPSLGLGPDPEEEMTEKQAVELRELTSEADEPFDGSLTRRQADRRIAHLKEYLN
jgi:hypothetical protein